MKLIKLIFFIIIGMTHVSCQSKFGKISSGTRLERIRKSPHYINGEFRNLNPTPVFTGNAGFFGMMKAFWFQSSPTKKPLEKIPAQKIDLKNLDPAKNILVWFGHSSYFLQIDGKKFLIDPVLSGHASPFRFSVKSFKGADAYTVDDIPEIDYLLITHDHWDHLDYETIKKIKPKVKKVITGLGTGAHLEYWGYPANSIIEKDWNESDTSDAGFIITATPGRHFSGRLFKRNQSLWVSFVIKTPTMKIFINGDSGYDTHFAEIGKTYGPFDIALMECGQYNPNWRHIHQMPEETVQSVLDLKAKKFLPGHWSKFTLAPHSWDEPINRVTNEADCRNVKYITPLIGEAVDLKNDSAVFKKWWLK